MNIGYKIYKKNFTDNDYNTEIGKIAEFCFKNNLAYTGGEDEQGVFIEVVALPTVGLDFYKQAKLNELKNKRDTLEVEPIEYNGNLFDFDEKARDRINSAIIALFITGQSIEWTTADNTNVLVTADDLRGIVANVAVRSNELHVKYRELKEQVENCTTKEELDNIKWDEQ